MRWKRGTHREAPGASSLLDYGRRCIPRQASTWIRKCGFATAEYPRSPNATPAAPSRRCRAGKRFADNFISKFSEPLDPNPQWRKHRGNVAANLGSLDRGIRACARSRAELPIPGNRPRFTKERGNITVSLPGPLEKEEPKLLHGEMPLVRSLTSLQRSHPR
jgi:hypothetical protein